jgi:hypothetical protein
MVSCQRKNTMNDSVKQMSEKTLSSSPTTNSKSDLQQQRSGCLPSFGNGRKAMLTVIFVCFIGFLVFLATASSSRDTLSVVMKIDFGLGLAMSIFGVFAIIRYHPLAIKIFSCWFIFNALLSLVGCTVLLVGVIQRMASSDQSWGQSSFTENETLNRYRDLLCATVLSLSCVFWLFSLLVLARFYKTFRTDYEMWKTQYKQDTCNYQMDASFHQWQSRHAL